MAGWFSVKRGITQHHLFKGDAERLMVWLWLLDNAAWKDTRHDVQGATVTVLRGSVCVSLRHISSETGVGLQRVRTAIKRFADENMIDTQLTHGKSMITLCNFEKYQSPNNLANTVPTQDQHSANTQKKQGNNKTREYTSSSDDGFDIFWSHAPRKVAKGGAQKAYAKALKKATADQLLEGIKRHAVAMRGKEQQFIPHPATWLNDERWLDQAAADTRKWFEKPESEWTKADRDAERMRHL